MTILCIDIVVLQFDVVECNIIQCLFDVRDMCM